jgi:hypothetical protein
LKAKHRPALPGAGFVSKEPNVETTPVDRASV